MLDIHPAQLNKHGEELCGDAVKIRRSDDKTIVVLSDGLGSGVKANILATLTAEILVSMLAADAPLDEVVRTVIGTLPTCKVRHLAYATFMVVAVDHAAQRIRLVNFDNPPAILLKRSRLITPVREVRTVLDRQIRTYEGPLEPGDFIGILSDGTLHAGIGTTMNFGWGWENVAQFVQQQSMLCGGYCPEIVRHVVNKTSSLYDGKPGDDATFVGISAREKRTLAILTGPPLDRADDERAVRSLLGFDGRKIICGGTTANIVGNIIGQPPHVELPTVRQDIPPIATLPGIDLVTEGILTMSRALELLRGSLNPAQLRANHNAASMLASEILHADAVHFIVGQRVNEFYQNPSLPLNVSLRKGLVAEYLQLLRELGKDVSAEYW